MTQLVITCQPCPCNVYAMPDRHMGRPGRGWGTWTGSLSPPPKLNEAPWPTQNRVREAP